MMELSLTELSLFSWCVLILGAVVVGISKTGVPGMGIVFVVLLPFAIPAKISTGYILPLLIFGDVVALFHWRNAAVWRHVRMVLPSMLAGIVLGFLLMDRIGDDVYGVALGGVVLFLLLLDALRRRCNVDVPADSRLLAWSIGLLAGVMTMMANAATSLMIIYLLALNISKEAFIGTGAWLYFLVNVFKVPFSAALGLITSETLAVNAAMAPFVLLGCRLGLKILKAIPAAQFERLMWLLAFLGGLKLMF